MCKRSIKQAETDLAQWEAVVLKENPSKQDYEEISEELPLAELIGLIEGLKESITEAHLEILETALLSEPSVDMRTRHNWLAKYLRFIKKIKEWHKTLAKRQYAVEEIAANLEELPQEEEPQLLRT